MTSKKHTRRRLLLDEGLPPKNRFLKLNNLHTLQHIKHDLKKGQSTDPEVYKTAEKEESLIMVFNTKDFKPMIKSNKPSVIALSTGLSDQQIDLKVCKFLRNCKDNQTIGHLISVSNENINIKKVKNN